MACLGSKAIAKNSPHSHKRGKRKRSAAAAATQETPTKMRTKHSHNNKGHKEHSSSSTPNKFQNRKRHGNLPAAGYGGMKSRETAGQTKTSSVSGKSSTRKKLDPETTQYYTEILSLLEKSTTDTEERAILCSNALDESRGKELQLACDKVFSRLFEDLILSCERDQLHQFLLRCIKLFPSMAIDQSGSHVAEAALKSLALALQDCDAKGESHTIVEDVLTRICHEVAENAISIMCSQYGSHVLRSLLCLCNGTLLESVDKFHRSSSASTLAGRVTGLPFQLPKKQLKESPLQAFPNLLKLTVSKILDYSRDNIAMIRKDTFGSLVLQAILRLLKGDDEAVVKVIAVILDCDEKNILKEGKVLEDASVQNVLELVMDPASSHLMEVVLEVAPDYIYMEILNRFFRNSLSEIAAHESGNFVVQSLISSSRDEGQVNMIWMELGSQFSELVKERKTGVIASLVAACQRFHTHERECCRALAHAVNFDHASPTCIVPRILHLEHFSCNAKGSDWQWPYGKKMSVLGCLMLQNIFSYPNDFIQQFSSSFASMEVNHILEAAKDPGGSRVIEAFLSSKVPLKHKHRVISKFRGHFGELAQHSSSYFTVLKCFTAADVTLKEAIASDLAFVQAELSRLKHGPHLLRVCDVTRYAKGPEQWRSSQSSKQSTRQAFIETFGTAGEAIGEDDNGMMSVNEVATEVPKNKGKKRKRNTELDKTIVEVGQTLPSKQDAPKLEHSMAELGFALHKQTKTKDANRNSGSNENESDIHRVKMASRESSFSKGDLMEKNGKDDIEDIFSKKVRSSQSNKGSKTGQVQIRTVNIVPAQVNIDSSLNNVHILQKGSKKKKRHSTDNPSTSNVKKQKQGKQMVFM